MATESVLQCESCDTAIEGVDDRGPTKLCDDCRLKRGFVWVGIIGVHALIIGSVLVALIVH